MRKILLLSFFFVFLIGLGTNKTYAQCGVNPVTSFVLSGTTNITCAGGSDGSINVTLNGGQPPYTYTLYLALGSGDSQISQIAGTSSSSVTFPGLFANGTFGGSYKVVVVTSNTGPSFCRNVTVSNIDLTEPAALAGTVNSITPSCTGNNGAIDLNISGGTPSYTYIWSGPTTIGNTQDPTNLSPGTYSVIVRDANYASGNPGFCETTVSNIVVPGAPATSPITGVSPVCANQSGVAYSVTNNAGSTYTWTITGGTQATGGTSNSITVNWAAAGSGNVRVVENTVSCSGSPVDFPVAINAIPVTSSITGTSPVCANSTVAYSVINTSGSTYTWTITGGVKASGGTTNSITVTWGAAGAGNVSVVEGNSGCTGTAVNFPVTINALPTATISYTGSPFCATGTASVNQTGQGGGTYSAAPAGLSINTTTGQINLAASTAGTYTVTYSFTDGTCPNTTTTSVIVRALPTATISYAGGPNFCATSFRNVTRTGQAGGTYAAAPAGLTINPTTGRITLSSSTPGSYTVTYSFSNAGCSNTTTTTVNVNALPTASISYTGSPFCATGTTSVTQTGQGGGTYAAAPAGLSINATTGQINLTASTAGTYTVTYSFTNGTCPNTTTATVTVNALPTAAISYTGNPFCLSPGTVNVTRTGQTGGTYSALPAGLSINGSTGQVDIGASTAGTYTVTYSFTNGTCPNTTTTSVTINALPTATISYSGSPFCATGTANVTQTGQAGGTYAAAPAGLSINATTGQINLTASTAGSYTVTYSFSNGTCANTTTATVDINALSVAAISYSGNPFCSATGTASVTQTGQAGGTYSASPSGLVINTTTGQIDIGASTVGAYTVTYTFTNGTCPNTTTTPVTINALPTASISYTGSPFCATGTASVTQTGQAGGTYAAAPSGLSINATTGQINLAASTAGAYVVTYSFSNGTCANTTTANVTVNALSSATISYSGTPFCSATGTVNVTQTGQGGGTYAASPAGLVINATTGQIDIGASTTGTYTVTYSFTNGTCPNTTTTGVSINALPTASINYAGSPFCAIGTASVTQTGQTGGTYSAAPAGLSINVTTGQINLAASTIGAYVVTYSFTNGTCANTTTANVTVNTQPVATISYAGNPFCSATGTVNVTQTGQGGGTYAAAPTGLVINVTTGQIDIGASTAGSYTVTYSFSSGSCSTTTTATVDINAAPTATISYAGNPFCSATGTASVTRTGQGGGTYAAAPAGLSINATTGQIDIGASTAGAYTVTYSFTNGTCPNTTTAPVTINALPTATISYTGSPFCSATGTVNVTQTGQGGGTYSASPAGLVINATTGQIDIGASAMATYTVTYSFTNGTCPNTTTTSVAINALPTATISYSGNPFCATGTVSVTQTGQGGGTYSSTTGLSINVTTGEIDLAASTAGTYTITYSFTNGTCPNTTTTSVDINALPTASISYPGGPFCTTGTVSVTQTGQAGGTYSSTTGLSINAATGEIDLSTSTAGTYAVTYNFTNGTCPNTTSANITIGSTPVTSTITGLSAVCENASGVAYSVTNTPGNTYTWTITGGIQATGGNSNSITVNWGVNGTGNVKVVESLATCLGTPVNLSVTINASPSPAVNPTNNVFCSGQPLTSLSVDAPGAGLIVNWYDASTGGNLVGTGASFTPATAGTFFAEVVNTTTTCVSASRVAATLTAVASPSVNNLTPTVCETAPGTGTATVNLTSLESSINANPGITITWFDDLALTSAIASPGSATVTASNNDFFAKVSDGSCQATANVVYTINSKPTATISGPASSCIGQQVTLSIGLTGVGPWDVTYSDGTTSFPINGITTTPHTFTVNPLFTTTYSIVSVSNTQCGVGAPSGSSVTVAISAIGGNPSVAGNETWIGYVYNDASAPSPPVSNIDFSTPKYRGFITDTEISSLGFSSTYNTVGVTDAFDLNLSNTGPLAGPNVCGSYLDDFSIRFRMNKTFSQGIYEFTVSGDDGVRLFIDRDVSNNPIPITLNPGGSFGNHSYTTYTSVPVCLTAGSHEFILEYFERGGFSRVSFTYKQAPAPTVVPTISACVNDAIPTLTATSTDPSATYRWYKDASLSVASLVATTQNYTPLAADLDMSSVGTNDFYVTAAYPCGETLAARIDVDVVNSATINAPTAATPICLTGGVIDLNTIVSATPAGTLTFTGTGITTSPNFDPAVAGAGLTTINVTYAGSCAAAPTSFDINVVPNSTITVPTANQEVCVGSGPQNLLALVSAAPTGGAFTFGGTGVTGSSFDPTGLSGIVPITVDYTIGGCVASQQTFNFNVSPAAILTVDNTKSFCPGAGLIDLTDMIITATPVPGTLTFSGFPDISGNMFDPSTHANSPVSITVTYMAANGCSAVTTLGFTIKAINDPTCVGGGGGCSVANLSKVDAKCNGTNDGKIIINSVGGGTGPYEFSLNNGSTWTALSAFPFTIPNLAGNTSYSLIFRDNTLCTSTINTVVIDYTTVIGSSVVKTDATTCAGTDGVVTFNTITGGGTPPYSYVITGLTSGTTSPTPGVIGPLPFSVNNLAVGSYSVAIQDNGGCLSASTSITIGIPATCNGTGTCASVIITPNPTPATCTNSDGQINFDINPVTPLVNNTGVKITITGVSATNQTIARTNFNNPLFLALPTGTYDYTIEYGDPGCLKTGQVTIDQSGTIGTPVASNVVKPVCAGSATGAVTIDVPGETGNSLEWIYDGLNPTDAANWKPFVAGSQITGIPAGGAPSFERVISVRKNSSDLCYGSVRVVIEDSALPLTVPYTITNATCNNNDGSIIIGTVTGGTAPYTYKLNDVDFASLPANNTFSALAGGTYMLTVTDANLCSKDFSIDVIFPGLVNFAPPVVSQPTCTGSGYDGVVSITITSTGSFKAGISKSATVPPTEFQDVVSSGNTTVVFSNLTNGIYFVTLQSTGAQCPTITSVTIDAGPVPVDFDFTSSDILCFDSKGGVSLTNIKGNATLDYTYEIISQGDIVQTGPITMLQTLDVVTLTDLDKGTYQIRLTQKQSCPTPISSPFKSFTLNGPSAALDTLYVNKAISLPDLPTGSVLIGIQESMEEPYEVKLELEEPLFPNQFFFLDYTQAARNPQNLKTELSVKNIYAGIYKLSLRDALGCEKTYEINLNVDTAISIPNIFTPNGDGVNDVFYIRNLPTDSKLTISNRWGNEVYSSKEYANDWNGGDTANGVYYYRLSASGETFTGWLEIQRGQ